MVIANTQSRKKIRLGVDITGAIILLVVCVIGVSTLITIAVRARQHGREMRRKADLVMQLPEINSIIETTRGLMQSADHQDIGAFRPVPDKIEFRNFHKSLTQQARDADIKILVLDPQKPSDNPETGLRRQEIRIETQGSFQAHQSLFFALSHQKELLVRIDRIRLTPDKQKEVLLINGEVNLSLLATSAKEVLREN